jgi:tetratricopeptide (TPR) repeat protein
MYMTDANREYEMRYMTSHYCYDEIDRLIAENEWPRARRWIARELRQDPDNHWLLTTLASIYYEERRYKTALQIATRAAALAPRCPLVLWDMSCALDMAGHRDKAIAHFKHLLRRSPKAIAHGECGEGLPWARSLINDCRFRLALCYADVGKCEIALRYLTKHESARKRGVQSIFSATEVSAAHDALRRGVNPRHQKKARRSVQQ